MRCVKLTTECNRVSKAFDEKMLFLFFIELIDFCCMHKYHRMHHKRTTHEILSIGKIIEIGSGDCVDKESSITI